MTEEAQRWISQRLAVLDAGLAARAADVGAVVDIISKLFLAFPSAQADAETIAARIMVYAEAINAADPVLPLWAVDRASMLWIGGKAKPGAVFAPTPAELIATAEIVRLAAKGEAARWRRVLSAEDEATKPVSPFERRMAAKATALPRTAPGSVAGEAIPTPELQAMLDAIRPEVKPMPAAERALIERMRAGLDPTPEMIAAVERAHE